MRRLQSDEPRRPQTICIESSIWVNFGEICGNQDKKISPVVREMVINYIKKHKKQYGSK